MDRPPFASLLHQLRLGAGLTQEELAARATVGVRTVRDLEAGRATRPQRSTVDLLAGALGLTGPARDRFEAAARGRAVPLVSLPRVEPLIGRADDLAAVVALLEVADLVTIVGLAGVGKAALAITVAYTVADRFPGGSAAVRVTDASTEAEVLSSVVSSLAASHVDELGVRLTEAPALLVVTNADRSPAAAAAAITWLRRQTAARVLVTARHPLNLLGEHQWALGPLEVPPPDAPGSAVFEYPATRLFLDRLRLVRAQPVAVEDAAVLGALVRGLGGLPCALELAAARGRVLDLAELLARTESDPAAGGDPAGQTVRSAVLASWELLTPLEQTCLCWLAAFQWRWSMDLAEELLAACPEAAGGDVVAVVDRLVGLGLVRARSDATLLRLHLFDAVRRVALEQAQARGILAAARDQHAIVIARLCARANTRSAARAVATDEAAGRTPAAAAIGYLLADIQAAADHLGTATERMPRQRAGTQRAGTQRGGATGHDAASDLRRGLVRWLGKRGLRP